MFICGVTNMHCRVEEPVSLEKQSILVVLHPFPRCPKPARESTQYRLSKLVVYPPQAENNTNNKHALLGVLGTMHTRPQMRLPLRVALITHSFLSVHFGLTWPLIINKAARIVDLCCQRGIVTQQREHVRLGADIS